jgi:UDP-N-acetylmuramate--alanine ligase
MAEQQPFKLWVGGPSPPRLKIPMDAKDLPASLSGFPVHLVGIKGTGMTALAEVLVSRGARVTGTDVADTFYTDAILTGLGIRFTDGFRPNDVPADARLVIHSAAFRRDDNPQLLEAADRGLPILVYPEALGMLSGQFDSSGVCGVHGKSTTTALCGLILKGWNTPATVLVGTEVPAFGGRCTWAGGSRFFVAETCEYRRHFLNFHPERILITNIEPEHLDYFKDMEDLLDAFEQYGRSLPFHGSFVYNHDDPGAREAALRIRKHREDLVAVPYGETADGDYRIEAISMGSAEIRFRLRGFPLDFSLHVPGRHNVGNAAGALALCSLIRKREGMYAPADIEAARDALAAFRGTRRRCEVVGEVGGILFMDDYGHHPTAIRTTLEGIRAFHPGRRLIVDFASHTYSRTRTLLADFASCFSAADTVILHKIYASAREAGSGDIRGKDLFREVAARHPLVKYFEEPMEAVPFLRGALRPGDLFVTMGAGDNWKLGRELYRLCGGGSA